MQSNLTVCLFVFMKNLRMGMRYFKVFPHVGLIDLQFLTNDNCC